MHLPSRLDTESKEAIMSIGNRPRRGARAASTIGLAVRGFLAFILMAGIAPALAQPREQSFYLGGFKVFFDAASMAQGRQPLLPGRVGPLWDSIKAEVGPFAGTGKSAIHGSAFALSFRDVYVVWDDRKNILVATRAGLAAGTGGRSLVYELDGVSVAINPSSISLGVDRSSAAVSVSTSDTGFFLSGSANTPIALSSNLCRIAYDGSLLGGNFKGALELQPVGAEYKLKTSSTDQNSVNLGRAFGAPRGQQPGLSLEGKALRENVSLFSFLCVVRLADKRAQLTLSLSNPISRVPEQGYMLAIKKGFITYEYESSGLSSCDGNFTADIGLPGSAFDENAHPIALSDVTLKTDQTGALFNEIDMKQKIRVGYASRTLPTSSIFLIEAEPKGAWIYFPRWYSPQASTSYSNIKADDCQKIESMLEDRSGNPDLDEHNVRGRTGLSVLKGVIYFKCRQAKLPDSSGAGLYEGFNLKTKFWGGLTLTPLGIAGGLTSSNASLIPYDGKIEDTAKPVASQNYTWDQMLNTRRQDLKEPKERFRLEDLRILGMSIRSLSFCSNALEPNSSRFAYNVHFPFPSFIDLDFVDESMDASGLFKEAKGPVDPAAWVITPDTTQGEIMETARNGPKDGKQLPVGKFFWAWRLPVWFSDRGVAIRYAGNPASKANVSVSMQNPQSSTAEVFSSEIGVGPLFSKSSGIKRGLRFGAELETSGNLKLTKWDTTPFLAKLYAEPGRETSLGFLCDLRGGIKLVQESSDAFTRPFDLQWAGSVALPFFGKTDMTFNIRNAIPALASPTNLDKTRVKMKCDNGSFSLDTNEQLRVSCSALKYLSDTSAFYSASASSVRTLLGQAGTAVPGVLHISSFVHAYVNSAKASDKEDYPISKSPASAGSGVSQVRQLLKDAVKSSNIVNLILYDMEAWRIQGDFDLGSAEYYLGTYQVQELDASDTVLRTSVSAPEVKFYQNSNKLDIDASIMRLPKSGSEGDSDTIELSIPCAKLAYDPVNGIVAGEFEASSSSISDDSPYGGVFKFMIDTKNGYYYFEAVVTFTYYLQFQGVVFIFNAPVEALQTSPFSDTDTMVEDLSMRSLFASQREFLMTTGLAEVPSGKVLTGALIAGTCRFSAGIGDLSVGLAAGAGLFGYRIGRGGEYLFGAFVNAEASAYLYIVEVTGKASFSCRSDFTARGSVSCCGCVNLLIGNVWGEIACTGTYSREAGLGLEDCGLHWGSGWGSCDGCE
jgi:hypothetical protein